MFIYIDNNQIRNYLLKLMKDENITYKKLSEKINTSPQNTYKMIHKKQLKFDDVSKICSALGFNFCFDFSKNSEDGKSLSHIQSENIKQALKILQEDMNYINDVQKEMENKVYTLLNQTDDKKNN